jgi:hypothetical protein
VVEVKEHRRGEHATIHPVIRFRTITGNEVTFESKFGSSNWKVKAGDRLEVLFHPDDPTEAEVVNFFAQWGLIAILGIMALGSIIMAPVVYLLFR